jgi:hypothetical protein
MSLARKIYMIAAIVGSIVGTIRPVLLKADDNCASGCCTYTTDCGSPSSNRCCLPTSGEANCSVVCPNYCFTGTSCSGA